MRSGRRRQAGWPQCLSPPATSGDGRAGCCWPLTWPGWHCCGGGSASRPPSGRPPKRARKTANPGPRSSGSPRVARALALSDYAIGLTLLALATTAELFALAWAAMRRGVSEIAVAGVVGSVAYNATATLGVAALVRPLTVTGVLAPAIAAAILPLALLGATTRGWLNRQGGLVLVIGYFASAALILTP